MRSAMRQAEPLGIGGGVAPNREPSSATDCALAHPAMPWVQTRLEGASSPASIWRFSSLIG
jgi:hypothetical protein